MIKQTHPRVLEANVRGHCPMCLQDDGSMVTLCGKECSGPGAERVNGGYYEVCGDCLDHLTQGTREPIGETLNERKMRRLEVCLKEWPVSPNSREYGLRWDGRDWDVECRGSPRYFDSDLFIRRDDGGRVTAFNGSIYRKEA